MAVDAPVVIQAAIDEHLLTVARLDEAIPKIEEAACLIAECLKSGGKVMFCGNGGSAADAQHLAAEFVGKFQKDRPPKAAIALTVDSSVLTCIGNDYSFEAVFSRQVRALGREWDCLVAISTSGDSQNVIAAADCARNMGLKVIGLCGRNGRLSSLSDVCIQIQSDTTARIQEAHILVGHLLCELTDA
jgi:D-sedoheptulose 7-phosphate isomerase